MTHDTTTSPLNAPDEATSHRMLTAFELGARRMGGLPGPPIDQVWGWRGRTLSGSVEIGSTTHWLRLASGRIGEISRTFWRGNVTAEEHLPSVVPRPRLVVRDEWETRPWRYAAEIFEHVAVRPISDLPAPPTPVTTGTLPGTWWSALRTSLDTVATVSTPRFTIGQVWAEELLIDCFSSHRAAAGPWTTCHGDLHWSNLASPQLVIFDWEGWGSGPEGYDAACLLVHSLLQPDLAAEVRDRFADVLDGECGRYAQQIVAAEQLWRRRDTPDDPLVPALHEYAITLR